ncbi:hypothetical protein [Algoriphagus sp.]|uniref:hypothetical protein n=1 Tax=Algoriphagus sp. TaxID=1872435 RepID=UPI003919E40D
MKSFVLSVALLLISQLVTAQDLKSYRGAYKFNGIEGDAVFNYQLNPSNESILQGEFKFESSTKGSYSENNFERKAVTGRFELNKKVGQWTYLDEHHQVTLDEVVDFKVISRLVSQQVKILANYQSGLPHGKWTIEENNFEEGKLKKAAQSDAIFFNQGNLVQDLQYKTFKGDNTEFFRAKLSEGGIIHGELTMVYESEGKLISEIRNYERGFLLGLVKRDIQNDELIEEVIFYDTIDKLKKLENGTQNGFRIADEMFEMMYRDGFLDDGYEYLAQMAGNQFLESFLMKLLKNDDSYINPEGELIRSPIHTKRFVYELSRADQKSIEEMPSQYRDNIKKISEYLGESTLNLLKNQGDSTVLAYKYLQLQAEKLEQLKNLFSQIESKRIQFLDLESLYRNYFAWIGKPDTIQAVYKEQEISQVVSYSSAEASTRLIQRLQEFLKDQRNELDKRFALFDIALRVERNSSELLKMSQEIEARTEKVRTLYADEAVQESKSASIIGSISENILINQLRALRTQFATGNEFVQKQADAEMILNLLTTTEDLLPSIKSLNNDFDKMDSLYQEEIFNPFTYTRYNQRVQERLFNSYELIYDYYIDEIKNSKDYNKLNSLIQKAQNLNKKMIELRGQDTRRLEQRLNREKSPLKLEALLGL